MCLNKGHEYTVPLHIVCEVEIADSFGDSVVSCDAFLGTLTRGCFAENRHVVFFWKLPRKRTWNALLEWMLERCLVVWK